MTTKEIKYSNIVADKIYFIKMLDGLGIQRKYTGYYSLIEIMEILVNEERQIVSFSREVYPQIAFKYGKTPCTVERNIRSLIKSCWCFDLMKKLNVYYLGDRKPTCREFIFLVKNYVTQFIV